MKKPAYETLDSPRPAFMDEMASYGFEARKGVKLPPVPEIGRIVRVADSTDKPGKQSGWYVYNEFADDFREGALIGVGVFGSWKGNPERIVWVSKRKGNMSPIESARLEEQIVAAKIARNEEKVLRQKEAAVKAQKIWDEAIPAPAEHPYLSAKGIKPNGVRISRGNIVVPLQDKTGAIVSLQFISPDGSKKFLFGGRVNGCSYRIGEPGDVIYVAEGFATAATIHEATGACCYVAYNAGNLNDVVWNIKTEHPHASIVIAGDDDRFNV